MASNADLKALFRSRVNTTKQKRAAPTTASAATSTASKQTKRPSSQAFGTDNGYSSAKRSKASSTSAAAHPSGLPEGFFDNPSAQKGDAQKAATNTSSRAAATSVKQPVSSASTAASRPRPTQVSKPRSAASSQPSKATKKAQALPEGFFDNPVADAKARKVPVRNKKEEEWTQFQKELEVEAEKAVDMMDADAEEEAVLRILEERDEQRLLLRKIDLLKDQKEEALKRAAQRREARAAVKKEEDGEPVPQVKKEAEDDDSSDGDDEDWDDLAWRSKSL